MSVVSNQVSVVRQARQDFEELRTFVLHHCPDSLWKACQDELKAAVASLEHHPLTGSAPLEFNRLNLPRFRQIRSGKLRIIYEVRPTRIYIHVIADQRRNLHDLLFHRLMRACTLH
jgi:toxin ParE1/3/4